MIDTLVSNGFEDYSSFASTAFPWPMGHIQTSLASNHGNLLVPALIGKLDKYRVSLDQMWTAAMFPCQVWRYAQDLAAPVKKLHFFLAKTLDELERTWSQQLLPPKHPRKHPDKLKTVWWTMVCFHHSCKSCKSKSYWYQASISLKVPGKLSSFTTRAQGYTGLHLSTVCLC